MPYDPTLGDTTSQVRLEIGDAGANPLLSDAFIEGVLAVVDDHVLLASEKCAWYLATKYAQEVDKSEKGPGSVGTKTDYQARAKHWFAIYDRIKARRNQTTAAPTMVGTETQIELALDSATMPKIVFYRGMFDNPANPTARFNGDD